MTSIALGIVVAFIIYVMIWSMRNDGTRSIGEQQGLIKMRDPERKHTTRQTAAAARGTAAPEAEPETEPDAATSAPSPSRPYRETLRR